MPRIGDIIEERANLVEEMRDVLNTAESAERDLTAEERQEYDRREERVQELEGDIRRYEESKRAEGLNVPEIAAEPPEAPEDRQITRDSEEYREAFDAVMRGTADAEVRSTLNVGTDGEGGFAVPESWEALYEGLREFGVIRSLATVIVTSGGGALHIPKVSADATLPALTAEEAAISDDGESFAEVVLNDFKYARITKASEEMATDALFDVASFVGRRLGEDLALATGAAYATGSGSSQPEGLFTAAGNAGTVATQGSLLVDEVIDLRYSVIAPYRANAVFVTNDSSIKELRKLKDSNGQYLWQPSVQAGQPDQILGSPVLADTNVPELGGTVNDPVIGYGNVQRAFTIRDVGGVSIKFLDQLYAGNDQVAWRGKLRTDSGVVDDGAFKVLHDA